MNNPPKSPPPFSLLTGQDLHLFNEGTHYRLYRQLGAHPTDLGDGAGTYFAVWAPEAERVCVAGDFNDWHAQRHPLSIRGVSGIWEGFVPGAVPGQSYKFAIFPRKGGPPLFKADPLAFFSEEPPKSASRIWDAAYEWRDAEWMRRRGHGLALDAPVSIYEVHLGSWRKTGPDGRRASYRELAPLLRDHALKNGFTHVEFLPVMEHPYYGSWGYQVTGYFAPTSRYGTPQDFMFLIDTLHQAGIGVILDWPCSHFATDGHGLGLFDGTHLYEHADPRQGFHPDWKSFIFNYGRNEVRSFLISNAIFWLDRYHADGLRVDAVASMLYLDYSRPEGAWIPNRHGGRENLEAIDFLRRLNAEVYRGFPGVQTIAEESTAWPMVSRPVSSGGLGFGYKWDMGWMHDTLKYLAKEPVHRKHHHDEMTFRLLYAFQENFVLPLSHDEVVHGKGSLLSKMPGDDWRKFANLRLLFGWLYGQPGKKLLFMGGELGVRNEWSHEGVIDWSLLHDAPHAGIERWVRDLNRLYRTEPSLHGLDARPGGFEWIDCADRDHSVLSFLRLGGDLPDGRPSPPVIAVFNFTPIPRMGYRLGAPQGGRWRELLNSDAAIYGGSGLGNMGEVQSRNESLHGRPHCLALALPPLACLFLKPIL
jgi:1,4-alpha-glucan branching enzyme